LPSSTAVNVSWQAPNSGRHTRDCQVHGYTVHHEFILELVEEYVIEYQLNGVPHLVKRWVLPKENMTEATLDPNSSMPDPLIGPTQLSSNVTGLIANGRYRFKVRTHTASGFRDSQWVTSLVGGVPSTMPAPVHNILYSSTTSVALSWELPDQNGGSPTGFEVFRNNGPGSDMSETADTTCLGVKDVSNTIDLYPEGVKEDLSRFENSSGKFMWDSISRVPTARGCAIPGLLPDTIYRFRVRALNTYGTGLFSPVAELSTGTVPFARSPSLNRTLFENCTLTFQWPPATERGTVVYHYSLMLARANYVGSPGSSVDSSEHSGIINVTAQWLALTTSGSPGEPFGIHGVQGPDGNTSQQLHALQTTVDNSFWEGLVPGGRYKAAVRARSTIAESAWSDWSNLAQAPKGYCFSLPAAPTNFQRDPDEPARSGQVRVAWDPVVDASQAGWDDPAEGHVVYNVWARPDVHGGTWRNINTIPSHTDHDHLSSTPLKAAPAVMSIDTYPETPIGTVWKVKARVGNRNGDFGPFTEEISLSAGRLPTAPRYMQASFSNLGKAYLYWQAPEYLGVGSFLKYQVRCTILAPWEDVENTKLSHVLVTRLPVGVIPCFVRAVNMVGPGPEATASVTVRTRVVEVT